MVSFYTNNPYVELARKALETYIINRQVIIPASDLPDDMIKRKAGVFVVIKKNNQFRGCIGTMQPTRENIALEIIQNAISAGTRDPRFYPVSKDELADLVYFVDVIKQYEQVESLEELDVKKYGLAVMTEYKVGLILPDIEGIETPEHQLYIALGKAGIEPSENYRIYRFTVTRYS